MTRQLTDAVAAQVMGEINTLTKRIDHLNVVIQEKIEAFPSAADKEMKRAGEAAIDSLSVEVAKIACGVAGNAAAAERQKSFAWAAASMTVFGASMYGVGLALGSKSSDGMGWGYLTILSMGAGIVGGIMLFQALFYGERIKLKGEDKVSNNSESFTFSSKKWTEIEFLKVAISAGISKTQTNACSDVLLNNLSIPDAAKKHQTMAQYIKKSLQKINDNR